MLFSTLLFSFHVACTATVASPDATADTGAASSPRDTGEEVGADSSPMHDSSVSLDTAGEGTSGDTAATTDTGTGWDSGEDLSDYDICFENIAGEEGQTGPDYDQFGITVGSHCYGTDQQDIVGIERVVFLGDSVTVGTPPTDPGEFYRSELSQRLATEFGLDDPSTTWEWYNILDGTSLIQSSGDFWSCAKWGARTDDLMQDNSQIEDCFPEEERDKTTLVVMTIGGNDLSALTEGFSEGRSAEDLWNQTFEFMELMREATEWFREDPARFPGGVHIIFTNLYEFTDATGDVTSCPAAGLAGYETITDPALEEMVIWAMEEFMAIAVDNNADMLFLLETFCGHGYARDDPNGRCYRGAGAELWFDMTCIHPNAAGHGVISDMFMAVVQE